MIYSPVLQRPPSSARGHGHFDDDVLVIAAVENAYYIPFKEI